MPEAILGSYFIKFEGDGRGVEAALKRTESAAAAGAARINNVIKMGVTDAMEKASRAATAAAPKMAGAFKDLTPVLRSANQEAARFGEKIRQGAVVAQGDIKRLIAVEKALEQQIIRTSGAVDKATAGATAGYNRVRQARLAAESAARQQRVLFSNAADRTTESGLRYSSMNDFAIDAARDYGKAGQVVSGLAGNLFIAVAAQKALSMYAKFYANQVIGSGVLEYWKKVGAEMMAAHRQRFETNRQNLWDSVLAAGSGDFGGAWRAANQGSGGGVDASGVASNGARLRAIKQYSTLSPGEIALRDADRAQFQRGISEGISSATLRLQRAEMEQNAAAARRLTVEIANLRMEEMLATGTSIQHAESVRNLTVANYDLAQAIKNQEEQKRRSAFMKQAGSGALAGLEDAVEANARRRFAVVRASIFAEIEAERSYNETRAAMHAAATERILANARMEADMQRSLLDRLTQDYAQHATDVQNVMGSALGSVENFLTDVLTPGAIKSFEDLGDAARNTLRSISAEIAKMMAQKAVIWLLQYFGGSTLKTGGSLGSLMAASPGVVGGAMGGVMPGGFTPLSAFAAGGVISRPTIGLVGEGRFNEAVVPLPDGRSIPVEMRSGGRQVVENHVTVQLGHGFMAGIIQAARPSPGEIIMTVGEDILTNGSLRKVIQSTVNS